MKVFGTLFKGAVRYGRMLVGKSASKTSVGIAGKSARSISFSENISKARKLATANEELVFDEILPLPTRIVNAIGLSKPGKRFYESLRVNKSALMAKLGLTSEEYNKYAALALKISKEESYYGMDRKYKLYNLLERTSLGTKFISGVRRFMVGDGHLSLGMTRFKISKAPDAEKELFRQFGITFTNNRSNILKPEQSAIATMIHLANLGKQYPNYLRAAYNKMPNLSSDLVQKSLANARRILFDDTLRPVAIKSIKAGEKVDKELLLQSGLYPQDLEDLKIYARTVILSEDAFIAAKWNGRKVMPFGSKINYAYANLLNIAAQKGYVSNIDKTSRVLY